MTIRITVHNDSAPLPLTVVGVREMTQVSGEVVLGGMHFLGPGKWQTFYLHDHQFLTVLELKNRDPNDPSTVAPAPPAPVMPEPEPIGA